MRITAVVAENRLQVDSLANLLASSIREGASLGYRADFDLEMLRQYWNGVFHAAQALRLILLVALNNDDEIIGTVQISVWFPPSQSHVAGISMLLVDQDYRRQGIGRALMYQAEHLTRDQLERSLLILQTARGSEAERLYMSLGYNPGGIIPRLSCWPDGTHHDVVTFWKQLY